jgi:hypothetical protein
MGYTKPETKRKWYAANRSKVNQQQRRWRSENRDKVLKYNSEFKAKHPDYNVHLREYMTKRWAGRFGRHIKARYQMTQSEYDIMLVKQHGGCAICGKTSGKRRLHVDHCHSTKKVRGLLCVNCNFGLGNFKDDPHMLVEAITYLTEVR